MTSLFKHLTTSTRRTRFRAFSAASALLVNACVPSFSDLEIGRNAAVAGASGAAKGGAGNCAGDHCAGNSGLGGAATGGTVESGGASGESAQGGALAASAGQDAQGGATVSSKAGGSSGGGTSGGGTAGEVDLPGVVSTDSEESSNGNFAANAHDGDLFTRWVAADGATGHYCTLDLGKQHRLSRFEVNWEYPWVAPNPSTVYDYTVSVSDDINSSNVVIDKRANNEFTRKQVVNFPSGTTGRFVRITVTGLPAAIGAMQYWSSILEFRVFGPP